MNRACCASSEILFCKSPNLVVDHKITKDTEEHRIGKWSMTTQCFYALRKGIMYSQSSNQCGSLFLRGHLQANLFAINVWIWKEFCGGSF